MRFVSLASGSKGNATLIDSGHTRLLIDCGLNRKHTILRLRQLSLELADIDALVVSHEHGDHSKGVVLVCESINKPFYSSYGTALAEGWLDHPLWSCIEAEQSFQLGDLCVEPVTVPHDAREPLQFVVSHQDWRVGVLSDLGSLTPRVLECYRHCHGLMLEFNYDQQLLQQGPYPPSLKRRVMGDYGHLSNEQGAHLLRRLLWPGLQHFMATHSSEKNNRESLVRQMIAPILGCTLDEVNVAEQGAPSRWFTLTSEVQLRPSEEGSTSLALVATD